jgi:hypothetical protein
MWLKRPAPVVCAVCGKAIDPRESRFVEKNRTTKIERAHACELLTCCHASGQST